MLEESRHGHCGSSQDRKDRHPDLQRGAWERGARLEPFSIDQ
jgi:hypothetical protein